MAQVQLLEQGRLTYANKKYNETAQICSKILSSSKGSTESQLNALDLRCQAYSKLGKYDLAKHDARTMIHLSKRKGPEGYIRCSQIERLLGDYTSAIKWLEHGNKNVPGHHIHFEKQIGRIRDLQKRQIADQKRQDPVASVPLEVLQLIISYLDYRQIVILLRVSRTWKDLLCRLHPLITTVDFTGARRSVSYLACSAAFRRLCRQPQTLVLPLLSQSAKNMVQSWVSKPTNLEHLETLHLQGTDISLNVIRLKKLHKIKSLQLDQDRVSTFENLIDMIATCRSLEDVSLSNISNTDSQTMSEIVQIGMQRLRLRSRPHSTSTLPNTFFNRYPNLRSLSIHSVNMELGSLDLSQHQCLHSLRFGAMSGSLELHLPPSLQDLTWKDGCGGRQRARLILCEPINLPNLTTIVLEGIWVPATIRALESSGELPEPIHIGLYDVPRTICETVPDEGYSILKTCKELAFHSEELRTEDSGAFAALFPNVESLILETPQISGAFVSDLLSKPECRLKEIKFKGCPKVSSDIRPWLASRNVACQIIQTPTGFKDARRILTT